MKMLATALAAVLYAIGWAVGIIAVMIEWGWSAVQVGWDEAHRINTRRVHAVPEPVKIPTSPGRAA